MGADSFGTILKNAAKDAGVDVSHVTVDPEESSGVGHITLEITEHNAKNRITVCPGANFTMKQEHIAWLKDAMGQYDIVIMQLELPMDIVETVAKWAKPRESP